MKVCVDIQPAIAQRAGVGRYTRALVEHLGACAGQDSLRLFYFDFRRGGCPVGAENAEVRAVRWCPGRLAQAAWKALAWPPFDLLAGAADLYHFPNFIVPPLSRGRAVVTIHDVSFLRMPEMAEERNLRHLRARIADTVRRADAIVTDSRFSAGEITELLRADPGKVHVTYPGVSPDFGPAPAAEVERVRRELGLDRPYVLTVGTLEPRKNVRFLVEVFEKMTRFDGLLAVAGMPGWKFGPIVERMKSSPRAADIRWLRGVSDAQLRALYTGAELFMFPSLYEGFGFPPLEALACGAPVMTSAAASLRETLGAAALVVDGFNAAGWAELACGRLGDRSGAERGRAQAAKYTWEETARRTWEVYRKAVT